MLEGALYGLDLLKLHSVTTKLVGRVAKLEEVRPALRFRLSPSSPKVRRSVFQEASVPGDVTPRRPRDARPEAREWF